jgi:hypothetical protein
MGSSSRRSNSAVKTAHFATIQPLHRALKSENSVLATCFFLVTFVTFYFSKIVEYNSSKAFSPKTAGNKLFKMRFLLLFVTSLLLFVT